MEDKDFDFWQDHSVKYLEMAFEAGYQERMEQPDGYGKKTGDCRDTIEIFIRLEGDRIQHVSFDIDGCMNTRASGNAVAHLVRGESVDDAWRVTPERVAEFLETLPSDHFHCAELAVGALYLALADARRSKKAPWTAPYRKR